MGSPPDVRVRKARHLEACLSAEVEYTRRTTGFERLDLPYRALPEGDLAAVDTSVDFLGRRLRAPLLIGAMTGGADLAGIINARLAEAAQRVGVGMMLGSQRAMLERPGTRSSFQVRGRAPDVLLLGNLGVAQLRRGYGAERLREAIELVGADGIALHTNPLQEALQPGGDGDFSGLVERLAEVVPEVGAPVVLKEVGHGISGEVARSVADVGFAAIDVAGAGGTSWAKVEDVVRHGRVRHPDLGEWGIPTVQALREVRSALPGTPLVASGGIRSGLDVAKALALGASVAAVARPLLASALDGTEAVVGVLERFVFELRVAMHCSGAATVADLRAVGLIDVGGRERASVD